MSTLELTSLVVLVLAFVVTALWKINLGVLLLAAAYVLTLLADLPVTTISAAFPADVVLLIVGITFFFAIIDGSGTLDYLVRALLRLMRGRVVFGPPLFFLLAALATGIGTYPAAAAAMILPIAMKFARDYAISPMLVGVFVVHGVLAGSFSPIATFGLVTDGVLGDLGIPSNPTQLFAAHVMVHAIVCCAAFLLFGGLKLVRAGSMSVENTEVGADGKLHRPTSFQLACMVATVALVFVTVAFDLDIGYVGFVLGTALTLAFARKENNFVEKMPWGVVLLLIGVLSFVGVLTEIGTISAIGDLLLGLESPALGVLALSIFGAITSAFASSLGILGTNLQLAGPLIDAGSYSTLDVLGPVTISTTIVDCSPLSIGGALILANAEPEIRPKLLRQLLLWGLAMVVVGPLVSWTLFTVL